MSEFDRLLGDSLKAIRDEHVRQIEPEVFAARQRIDHRLRGRRVRFVIGGTAMAAAALAAFVFVSQTVPKLDRATPIRPSGEPVIVNRIDVPGVGDMEPGLGALWVSHPDGLVGIDPASGSVTMESPVDADAIATNSDAVFAINSDDRSLNRLPFGTNEAGIGATMEGTPTAVAASEEAVWVAAAVGPAGHSQVTAYTPHLEVPGDTAVVLDERVVADMTHAEGALWMSVARTDGAGVEVRRFWDEGGESAWELSDNEGAASDIVVGEGSAWVLRPTRTGLNAITQIKLDWDEMSRRVDESAVNFEDTIESIAVGEGYLWVTTAPTRMNMPKDAPASLHRIDPATLEPVGEPLEVGGPGSQVEVGSGFVWVGDPNSDQIVQIDPHGAVSPQPDPPETPQPTPTETHDSEPDEKTDVDPDEAFAMWPETTPEEAAESCSRAADQPNSSRRQPESVAVVFADEVLGWEEVVVGALDDERTHDAYRSVTIQRGRAPKTVPTYAPRVNVTLREVVADCWSVSSVRTINDRVPDDAPTGLSVSSVDGVTRVAFDLDREAAGHEVESLRLRVGPGSVLLSAQEFEEKGWIELTDAPVGAPTHLLVLLFDPNGEVVGAIGQALPAGDFVAG